MVSNGTVDLACGSATNNLERQKQVAFFYNFFVVGTRLLIDKASGIKDYPDLKGKTVVTTAGTTFERMLKEYNEKKKWI
ncbi:transporter substrate-binding domain-containing protein [Kingella kingae]|uniref:transporter substrate-binding domain-containing protein n=1 Tax=Kingella kingae TaxID=504 RepID=UPI0003F8D73F|nr:transporter substrate-binding domain-containing protein [Kingella kingae]